MQLPNLKNQDKHSERKATAFNVQHRKKNQRKKKRQTTTKVYKTRNIEKYNLANIM